MRAKGISCGISNTRGKSAYICIYIYIIIIIYIYILMFLLFIYKYMVYLKDLEVGAIKKVYT